MGTLDILLLLIIGASLVVGFFWGALRSVMLLAAWLAAFLAGAHLKVTVGSLLARQWIQFHPTFNEMAAFGLVYLGVLAAAPLLIFIGSKGDQSLVRWETLNDLIGAMLAMAAVVLGIAGTIVVLNTFYAAQSLDGGGAPVWVTEFHHALKASTVGSGIEERLLPIMEPILRLLLPADVNRAMLAGQP